MKEEKSSGVVIYNKKNSNEKFLLLNYPSGHWDFVKGRIEKDENLQETAIRETKEETGIIDLDFVDGFEEKIEYHFQFEGKLIHKEVIFFLAETKTTDVSVSHEHIDYTWLEFGDALKKVTFQNAKNVLTKAKNLLSKT